MRRGEVHEYFGDEVQIARSDRAAELFSDTRAGEGYIYIYTEVN